MFKARLRYKKSVQVQLDTQNVNSKYASVDFYRHVEYFATSTRSVAEFIFLALYKKCLLIKNIELHRIGIISCPVS